MYDKFLTDYSLPDAPNLLKKKIIKRRKNDFSMSLLHEYRVWGKTRHRTQFEAKLFKFSRNLNMSHSFSQKNSQELTVLWIFQKSHSSCLRYLRIHSVNFELKLQIVQHWRHFLWKRNSLIFPVLMSVHIEQFFRYILNLIEKHSVKTSHISCNLQLVFFKYISSHTKIQKSLQLKINGINMLIKWKIFSYWLIYL